MPIHILQNIADLREQVADWRKQGEKIAFVPTMGNLHEGHLSLVREAKSLADKVVVSIYVNPMQFGANEDFDTYPRTIEADSKVLVDVGADALFLPTTKTIYPRSVEKTTQVVVPGISDILCGEFRPGHFAGVATVVCKLLNLVDPDVLVLGAKDYQQVAVIRHMVEDLNFSVDIVAGETVREPDGLAKSSRNQYLSLKERQLAPILHKIMLDSVDYALEGRDLAALETQSIENLEKNGFKCDYFQFRDAYSLERPSAEVKELVLLAAAYLGRTRLIDNIRLTLH